VNSVEPAGGISRWLTPRLLIPVTGVLGVAAVVLGVLVALGSGGGTMPQLVLETCRVGEDPGCQLREEVHEHADFALVIRGQQYDFSDRRYVSAGDTYRSPIVHIHPERYTVVHVHLSKTTWDEFFSSIGFKLVDPSVAGVTRDQTCLALPSGERLCNTATETWKFYVNGVKVDGLAFEYIYDLDRVLLSYGPEDEAAVLQQVAAVSDQACILSLRCMDRVDASEPPELCQGGQSCAR
jgi:hypothetical protein